jgi:sulfatase maturation enzyme AslB (radical SAM superfamily)
MAMWQSKGIAENFRNPIIATYSKKKFLKDWIKPSTIKNIDFCQGRFLLAGISSRKEIHVRYPVIYNLPLESLAELHEGDVLYLDSTGIVRRIWNIESTQNVLFVTERCNSHCIMCPQPQLPIEHDEEALKLLDCIPKNELKEVCITGGEPTTCKKICNIFRKLQKFPYIQPIMLTNGRKFSELQFTKNIVDVAPYNMIYAIPIYSSVPYI